MSAKGYGLFFIFGGAYLFLSLRVTERRFQLVISVFAGWVVVIGLLLWFRFLWSPELYLATCILVIGWSVARTALDGYTTSRVVIFLCGLMTTIAYPDLRRQLRGKMVSDLGDDL